MVAQIIPLNSHRPHGEGEAFCLFCKHQWRAVVPMGETDLECPECHTMKGRLRYEYWPPTGTVWECGCGNQYFYITEDGYLCPNCGIHQRF